MGKLVPSTLAVAAVVAVAAGLAVAATSGDTYTYKAAMTRGAEVPKPKAPAGAKGAFTATVVENGSKATIAWTLTFSGLSGKAVGAHIHKGKPGVAGPVVVALCGPCRSGMKGRSVIAKSVSEMLERGGAYVNVHTTKNAGGEIRGQVKLVVKADTAPSGGTDDNGGGSSGTGSSMPTY
jgi:hypothetical protein